jgi:Leucine-rich repeat (LRR) protein
MQTKDPVDKVALKFQAQIGRSKEWLGGYSAEENTATWSRGEVVFDSGKLSIYPKDPRSPAGLIWIYPANKQTYVYLADCKPLFWARTPRLDLPPALEVALRDPQSARDLKLANAGLKALPSEVVGLSHLEKLDLTGNEIARLPDDLSHLKGLKILWLDGNPLKSLPPGLTELSEFNSMKAINCQLGQLPGNFEKLEKLRFLSLDQNPLHQFPAPLLKMNQLQYLCMADAQLEQLPAGLPAMKGLLYLDVRRNRLTTLPRDLGQMVALGCIRLGGNPLPPQEISWLKGALPKCIVDERTDPDLK